MLFLGTTKYPDENSYSSYLNSHGGHDNAKNFQADGWRILQLVKSTANPNHPFSKFGTGNLETLRDTPKKLGVNTRDELIKFHATYYSANRMKLAVCGRESLDQLEAIV